MTSRIYSKGCTRRKIQDSHQGYVLYPHPNYPDYPYYTYPSIPPRPHPNISPHLYPRIPPHPICSCTYFTSSPICAPYGVSHQPCIPSLGYLYRPAPSIIPYSMLPNLLPPDLRPHYESRMSEHRSNRSNQRSNLMKVRSIYNRISR